jgi:hypothetical protein
MESIMTNTTFTFNNFKTRESLLEKEGIYSNGKRYTVGNVRIYIAEEEIAKDDFFFFISIGKADAFQKDFLLKNGFKISKSRNLIIFDTAKKEEFEKAKEVALKAIFAGALQLESGIGFSKEAKDEFAKHQKFIMRKHNDRMRFYDAVTKVVFWETSPIKEIGKYQNGYYYFVTESEHKYQITTINQ